MLRKMARSISRGRERPPSPEFVSKDARALETLHRTDSGDRVSRVHDSFYTLPDSPSQAEGDSSAFNLGTGLEALSLETLIKPTLERMRPKLREAEKLLPPLPDLPPHSRRGSLTMPEPVLLAAPPIARATAKLRDAPPQIVVTPAEKSNSSSSSSEHNPFEFEFGALPEMKVTPMPKRPILQRKAVSYRTQRELPLRVQAVRRSHQEQYARQILERSQFQRAGMGRRASESVVPSRPKPTPVQTGDAMRSQSISHVQSPQPQAPRSRSTSRTGSRNRHERMPSGPHRARSQETEDFYLINALSSWEFKL